MKPTQSQIIEWFNIANESNRNPVIDFSISGFINNPDTYIKHFLLDLKSQIDRWDLIMDYLFIHPQIYDLFISYLGSELDFVRKDDELGYETQPVIWGIKIVTTVFIPYDKVLGYTNPIEDQEEGINIVVGNINFNVMDRLNKIRAFW